MRMPRWRAASRIVVPSGTLISRPSISIFTLALMVPSAPWVRTSWERWLIGARLAGGRGALADMVDLLAGRHGGASHQLIREVLHNGQERVGT